MFKRRIVLSVLIALLLLWAFCLIGIDGDFAQYLKQNVGRCTSIAYLALGAAVLISAGQIDLSCAHVLNLSGIFTIAVANAYDGTAPTYISIFAVFLFTLALYSVFGRVLSKFSRISALMLTLSASLVIAGVNNFILIGLQGSDPLALLINPDKMVGRFSSLGPNRIGSAFSEWWLHAAGFAVVFGLLCYWRYRSARGLHHVALGESPLASLRVGIVRSRILFCSLLDCGRTCIFCVVE